VKAAGSIFSRKVVLIGLLLLANIIGYLVARNYFTRNACMTCSNKEEMHEAAPSGKVKDGSKSILNWTYTLIRQLGTGGSVR